MEKKPTYFTTLNMLHKALLTGQMAFAGIAFYLVYSKSFEPMYVDEDVQTKIFIGLGVFCALMILLSFSMFRNKIIALSNSSVNVSERLSSYRAINLVRWATIEAPVLVAVVAVMLTGNMTIYALIAAMLILFVMSGPTIPKAAIETGLPEEVIENAS